MSGYRGASGTYVDIEAANRELDRMRQREQRLAAILGVPMERPEGTPAEVTLGDAIETRAREAACEVREALALTRDVKSAAEKIVAWREWAIATLGDTVEKRGAWRRHPDERLREEVDAKLRARARADETRAEMEAAFRKIREICDENEGIPF